MGFGKKGYDLYVAWPNFRIEVRKKIVEWERARVQSF